MKKVNGIKIIYTPFDFFCIQCAWTSINLMVYNDLIIYLRQIKKWGFLTIDDGYNCCNWVIITGRELGAYLWVLHIYIYNVWVLCIRYRGRILLGHPASNIAPNSAIMVQGGIEVNVLFCETLKFKSIISRILFLCIELSKIGRN